jgi:predicted solute-binding protein
MFFAVCVHLKKCRSEKKNNQKKQKQKQQQQQQLCIGH